MIIFGTAISALLAGLSTGILGSAEHRTEASVNTVLRSYAEAVKKTARETYRPCPASSYPIDEADYARPNGWSAPTNTIDCDLSGALNSDEQLVRITVVAPQGNVQTLDIWVRRP